jgi:5-methyltetrahydropteroyltriglutamate--homocysteine methyltransferase
VAIPSEAIGSIPRPPALIEAARAFHSGRISQAELHLRYESAVEDTVARLEATGSTVVTDGEQGKDSFVTYPIHGLSNIATDGIPILFADGHVRQFPRLTEGPFGYRTSADVYLDTAQRYAHVPVKQAVVSPSALSLLYPQEGIPRYSREEYFDDLLSQQEGEIRRCLAKGAHVVQIDFTEGRLSVRLDPTGRLLSSFIDLNNLLLERFSAEQRKRIGIHTCPGADRDSTHSAGVDYAALLPSLFELKASHFYVQLASEPDRERALKTIRKFMKADHRIFVGVIDVLDPRVETPEEVRDRILQAAKYIPLDQLGTTDDCGFAPFSDDTSRSRDTAFAKIRARVAGTHLAAKVLGLQ